MALEAAQATRLRQDRQGIDRANWDANDDQSKHTPLSAAVFEKIMADFTKYGDNYPRILSIYSIDIGFFFHLQIDIQLPGGVVIEIDPLTSSGYSPAAETLAEAFDQAARSISDIVSYCAHFGFEKLTKKLDDARSGLKKLFKQWSNDGDTHIDIVDLRIRPVLLDLHSFDTPVQITISCLSEALVPEIVYVEARGPEAAVTEVMKLHAEMKTRTQAKARLERQGADGFIDLIAMNSLLLDGSAKARPEDYLPTLREPDLHPDYKVTCGRLYLEATDSSGARLNWHDGYIEIFDLEIPSTLCDSLPGKPITDLIEHPFLTPEIIIKDLRKLCYGEDYYKITFKQPYFFYSRDTGLFWK